MAEDERGAYGLLGPAVVVADVQVGAADAGTEHLDQYVRGADLRLRHVHQPESRLGLLLHECLHGSGSLRWYGVEYPGPGAYLNEACGPGRIERDGTHRQRASIGCRAPSSAVTEKSAAPRATGPSRFS
ncbi:hypothetical protein GCM10009647_011070 [Streptomyces sanglieri]